METIPVHAKDRRCPLGLVRVYVGPFSQADDLGYRVTLLRSNGAVALLELWDVRLLIQ